MEPLGRGLDGFSAKNARKIRVSLLPSHVLHARPRLCPSSYRLRSTLSTYRGPYHLSKPSCPSLASGFANSSGRSPERRHSIRSPDTSHRLPPRSTRCGSLNCRPFYSYHRLHRLLHNFRSKAWFQQFQVSGGRSISL